MHKFPDGLIGKSVLCASGKIGADKEPLRCIVYKKGRKLPPHSPHLPPVVGIGGRARVFVSVQAGGPDPRPIQPHRAPTSTHAVGSQNDPNPKEIGGIFMVNPKTMKKELVSTGMPRKSRRIKYLRSRR